MFINFFLLVSVKCRGGKRWVAAPTPSGADRYFIGWTHNHFNNLHFTISLEANTQLHVSNTQYLPVCIFLIHVSLSLSIHIYIYIAIMISLHMYVHIHNKT